MPHQSHPSKSSPTSSESPPSPSLSDPQPSPSPAEGEPPGSIPEPAPSEGAPAPASSGARPFSELGLPAPVARALAARGYEMAMPVQAAVLDGRCAGRDLLVSSQTGSGKTIAFGIAIGQALLPEGRAKVAHGPRPVTLVIVPTRELAIQVRDELTWLLRETGARVASFTGGTAVGGDLAALKRGVDVAIGTPGRLVDLVRRERLDLADVAVLVLDEADEMLDLGFREDLETLLKAAPSTRRTLMLSATLPSEIRAMARQFQRDALPIDPRRAGPDGAAPAAGGAQAHDDIAYLAHLIAPGDRLAAVINILRASDAERAIVFCTTRDGVGVLHGALLARGFAATAISGERAQAERDRALDQVRRGEAHVLVATNVAARGLHLPDVDLIIHADLPLNPESLTHRSGRTGRAGRKGTAVLLSTLTERRKAERLLAAVNVRAVWTTPPSADAIARAAGDRLIEELAGEDGGAPRAAEAAVDDFLQRLGDKVPAEQLVRRLARRELLRLPGGERLRPVAVPPPGRAGVGAGPPESLGRRRSPGEMSRDGVLFRVNVGAQDNAEPRWLLPLICRRGGVTNREVGAIRVGPRETWFEIAGEAAADFAVAAAETDPRAPHVRIERSAGRGPVRGPTREVSSRPVSSGSSARRIAAAPSGAPSHPAPETGAGAPLAGRPPHARKVPASRPHEDQPPAQAQPSRDRPPAEDRPSRDEPYADNAPADELVASQALASEPSAPGPHAYEPSAAKPPVDKPSSRKPYADRPHAGRPFADKPFADRRVRDKPFADKPFAGKPFADKPFADKPFAGKPFVDKPFVDKPFAGKPFADKPFAGRPFAGKAYGDRSSASKPYAGKPYASKPYASAPRTGAPDRAAPYKGDEPYTGKAHTDRPYADKPYAERTQAEKPYADKPHAEKPYAGRAHGERSPASRPYAGKPPASKAYASAPRSGAPDRAAPYQGDKPYAGKPRFDRGGFDTPRADRPHESRAHAPAPRARDSHVRSERAGSSLAPARPRRASPSPNSFPRGKEVEMAPIKGKRT